jgi:hypothetical protein
MESPDHPCNGISEKLKRADENIVNLAVEINLFFQESKYPVIPDPNDKAWQEAVNYHRNLPIPKRFSVLAGEIVHHLRSSLDHIVWIFSDDTSRRLHASAIEFPVLSNPPGKDELRKFNRQIQGVRKNSVRKLISDLQPYHLGADSINSAVNIVHEMDRFDKHRELVIVTSCANVTFPNITPDLHRVIMSYAKTKTVSPTDLKAFQKAVKNDAKVTPQVAFAKFGKWEGKFVIPSLSQLLDIVIDVTKLFADEL